MIKDIIKNNHSNQIIEINRQINVQKSSTGYKLNSCFSGEFRVWKQFKLHFKVKSKANIPIAKFIKNDLINKFIMNTMNDKNIIGAEQYKIRHKV